VPSQLGVENFSLVGVALVAGAAGGAVRVAQTGRFRWYATSVTPYMALLSLAAILSCLLFLSRFFIVVDEVFAGVMLHLLQGLPQIPKSSMYHTLRGLATLLGGFVFFHVVVARVRDTGDARRVLRLSLVSVLLVSLFGICQYYTDWWRIDFAPWARRVNATFEDVNSHGSFIVANLFLMTALLSLESGRRPRGLAWLVLPIVLVNLWLTQSRAAMGALVLTLPLFLVLRFGGLRLEKPTIWLYKRRRFLALCFVLTLLLLVFVFYGLDWVAHTDLEWTRSTGRIAQVLKGRFNIWRSALYNIAEAPWLGRGIGTFYVFLQWHWEYVGTEHAWNWNPLEENAHNYFLQMFAETGVVGGGLFLLVVALVFYQGLRAITMHQNDERVLFVAVFSGLAAFFLTCVTGHPLVIVDLNLWVWAIVALLFVPHPDESPEFARVEASRRGFRRFLLAAILLAAVGVRWSDARAARRSVFQCYGFHAIEYLEREPRLYPFFWLERRAVCRIYQRYPDLTFSLRNELGANHPIAVTIRVNDRGIDTVHLDDRRWHRCSYRLPETTNTAIKLEILSDYEYSLPHDRRRLAVQIQSLLDNRGFP
jgi:O-antigen ligase